MTDDRTKTRRVSEQDFFYREDVYGYVSRDDYNWLRYPRSGPTSIGWVCFGSALAFLLTYFGRLFAWATSVTREDVTAPEFGNSEGWAIALELLLAVIFWSVGKSTSKRTRQIFGRWHAIFYPDEVQPSLWGRFCQWLKSLGD